MSIAYQGKNDLCFDTEVFATVSKNLNKDAADLATILSDLTEAVDDLKVDWKSKASDKFFELVSDDWATDLQRYSDLVTTLAGILTDASTTYSELETAASKLEFDPDAQ